MCHVRTMNTCYVKLDTSVYHFEINAYLKRLVLWRHIKKLNSKWNMRADSGDSRFWKNLLDIGEGKYPEINNSPDIEIPLSLCQVVENTDTLIQTIYDDVRE